MTVGGENESHRKLGDRFRRITGNAEDFDVAFSSSFEIYIIIITQRIRIRRIP